MDNWKITFGGKPMTLVGKHLAAGDRAPLIDQNLQPVSLTQYKDKTVVISVFPSVDTSVCALQNIRFNREATKLDGDVAILSLSVDLPFAQNVSVPPRTSTTCTSIRTTATWTSA